MIKIAVATEGKYVSEHFGHCEGFTFYELVEDRIAEKSLNKIQGIVRDFCPIFIRIGNGCRHLRRYGRSGAAVVFCPKQYKSDCRSRRFCDDVVQQYLKGKLKSTGSVCGEHQHKDLCHE